MLFPGCAPALTPFLLMTTPGAGSRCGPIFRWAESRRWQGEAGAEKGRWDLLSGNPPPRPMLHPVAAPAGGGKGEVRLVHP